MDAFIAQHLRGVSRTYAVVIPMLPGPLAEAVGLAYLVMRIVDTLEDDPQLTADERRTHFAALHSALAGNRDAAQALAVVKGDNAHERALLIDAGEVCARTAVLEPQYAEAIRRCARVMSDGVVALLARSEQRGQPYPAVRDAGELREYCYYVAGVVGEMLCAMMVHFLKSPALERLREVAVELGIGLQLVNILKDALKDSNQGRRYLPQTVGGTVAHGEVYRAVLAEARHSLARGVDFVLALPATASGLRLFCGLPLAWGAMTLARAAHDAAGAKISRAALRASMTRFGRLAGDDAALRQWLGELLGAIPAGVAIAPRIG